MSELPGVSTGFIAQEVEVILPDWVEEAGDGYKRLVIRSFEALAVEAIRELHAELAELRKSNAELRQRIDHLMVD